MIVATGVGGSELVAASRKRRIIGVLTDFLGGDYQNGVLRGVEAAAAEHDVSVLAVVGRAIHGPSVQDAAHAAIYERLTSQAVDGVVITAGCIGVHVDVTRLAEFCDQYGALPRACIGMSVPGTPSLIISNYQATRTVIEHFLDVHRSERIAYIRGPLGGEEAQQRYQGYADALASRQVPFDPNLVEIGNFWIESGAEAMRRLFDRNARIDAVVAANDYMALGAIDEIRRRGLRIPRDILLAGFDDVPSARVANPSLTTVRQPLETLGRRALELVLAQLSGAAVPAEACVDIELVIRESCGCGTHAQRVSSTLHTVAPCRHVLQCLEAHRPALVAALERATQLSPEALGGWAKRLLRGLEVEFGGKPGAFIAELEDVIDACQDMSDALERLGHAIRILRAEFHQMRLDPEDDRHLQELWHSAIVLLTTAFTRGQLKLRIDWQRSQAELYSAIERLTAALDEREMMLALRDILPRIGVGNACIASLGDGDMLRPFFVMKDGKVQRAAELAPYAFEQLVPAGFWAMDKAWAHVLLPLTHISKQLGVVVFESGAPAEVYAVLREQVAATMESAALHRAIVAETALRERAERDRLLKETEIARQIQTEILPSAIAVEGLEIGAIMVPAEQVGGDYYDVFPAADGCWIGIGDVTGHGLLAGLIMMMVQSIFAGLVESHGAAKPSELVAELNRVLYRNVRHRLRRDEYATLTLIRYTRDGRLVFAGCHEEIIVWRRALRRCERIGTVGVWTGALPEVQHLTHDSELRLADGDLLVLYTDGVIEALSAEREHFGVERLCALIETLADRPVNDIPKGVVQRVHQWANVQADDITVVVGRYSADSGA